MSLPRFQRFYPHMVWHYMPITTHWAFVNFFHHWMCITHFQDTNYVFCSESQIYIMWHWFTILLSWKLMSYPSNGKPSAPASTKYCIIPHDKTSQEQFSPRIDSKFSQHSTLSEFHIWSKPLSKCPGDMSKHIPHEIWHVDEWEKKLKTIFYQKHTLVG